MSRVQRRDDKTLEVVCVQVRRMRTLDSRRLIFDEHGRWLKGHPQPWKSKPIHSRELVLAIVKLTEYTGPLRIRDVRIEYNRVHKPISQRHLLNVLKELECEGKLSVWVESDGKHGRTSMVQAPAFLFG